MDLHYTPEEAAFRDEVRAFLHKELPPALRYKLMAGQRVSAPELRAWQRKLYEKGWATPAWDTQWGGTGWTAVQQYIFKEEIFMAPAPEPLSFNINMIGPVLIAFGSEEQKRRFLPKIASLEYWFCQGFSEPGSGSDLASLSTRAVRDGDHYVVTGRKIWTSNAKVADWCFLLVRTDASAKNQLGITYLLVDMTSPGIAVRPISMLDGTHDTNEVVFDEVRVPVAHRVGEENRGWEYAKYLLGNERAGIGRPGVSRSRLRRARDLAARTPKGSGTVLDDPLFRAQFAELEVELKALEITQMRAIATKGRRGSGKADPMASILKLKGAEMQQRTSELLLEIAGCAGLEFDAGYLRGEGPATAAEAHGSLLGTAPNYYTSRAWSILGGTDEIPRNVLAKTVLDL